jgi:hypothetical protein
MECKMTEGEAQETPKDRRVTYIYGNINNYNVYEAPVTYNAPTTNTIEGEGKSNDSDATKKKASPDQIMKALDQSKAYIWGNAAYTVAFCVVRDDYDNGENASSFERLLNENGIALPEGTLNAAISRNPWMRYDVDKWDENGAMERAIKLRDFFRQQMIIAGLPERKKANNNP